jgi:hypothetical protein
MCSSAREPEVAASVYFVARPVIAAGHDSHRRRRRRRRGR